MKLLLFLFLFSVSVLSTGLAELTLASVFTDNAVLQRDAPIAIWGTASLGETVTVAFADQSKIVTADTETGKWRIDLDSLSASSDPRSLKVTAEAEMLTVSNLVVGEVWLASGQSNMAMRVDLSHEPDAEKAASDLPHLRVFSLDRVASPEPLDACGGEWVVASPEVVGRFSATGFFFARELHQELDVPVGLIVAAWGGSAIEAWTSSEVQTDQPALQPLLKSWAEKDAAYTSEIETVEKATYETAVAEWKAARKEAIAGGTDSPRAPRRPINPRLHHHHPTALFNGMIAPLIPYTIRGAIWYQGETNAFTEETSSLYELQLPLLINDWRARWGQGEFPFAWVQLPPSRARQVAWARMRESMRRALALPNTGMAVTIDLDEEPLLLHPKNKKDYAHRLALWARATVYGSDLAWSGPQLSGYRAGGNGVLLTFDDNEDLASAGKSLTGFEIQTAEGEWVPAKARIRPDGIGVTAKGVRKPLAARYAWGNHPEGNLTDASDLPASPFTTEGGADQGGSESKTSPSVAKKKRPTPLPAGLNTTPFVSVDVTEFPGQTDHLDIVLLIGQSNMKGRGVMPAEPYQDPQIIMLHKRTDEWFYARHPLHHVGDPNDFTGSDNAGVGPGLAFAKTLAKTQPATRIALIPCAVGGTSLAKWQKGQLLYEETIRRAKLALEQGPKGKSRIAGALWLQGESDSGSPERIAKYAAGLKQMIEDLRADTGVADLPFVACTIGELKAGTKEVRAEINAILLDLPNQVTSTACVDSREFAADIGDSVHFDTPTQVRHGELFARELLGLDEK